MGFGQRSELRGVLASEASDGAGGGERSERLGVGERSEPRGGSERSELTAGGLAVAAEVSGLRVRICIIFLVKFVSFQLNESDELFFPIFKLFKNKILNLLVRTEKTTRICFSESEKTSYSFQIKFP